MAINNILLSFTRTTYVRVTFKLELRSLCSYDRQGDIDRNWSMIARGLRYRYFRRGTLVPVFFFLHFGVCFHLKIPPCLATTLDD